MSRNYAKTQIFASLLFMLFLGVRSYAQCTNPTPTGATNQSFYACTDPMVSDLVVTPPGSVWYDSPTGGTAYAGTETLLDGITYYADDESGADCSVTRLAVTVTIIDEPMGAVLQGFCSTANATVGDLNAVGNNIQWYDALNGGNLLSLTDPLVDGMTYFASQTDPVSGCESSRLEVNVIIIPAPNPPAAPSPQEFCLPPSPTIADLQVTGSNLRWYATATSTVELLTSELLVNGEDYYVSQTVSGCTSSSRTRIDVILSNTPEAGTASPFAVCENDLAANSPLDLFSFLSGNDAGGVWSDDNGTGALSGSDVDLTLLTPGSYNFTYTVTTGTNCSDTATVTITVDPEPNAGTATPFEVCELNLAANSPLDLFGQLTGHDTGGTWNDDDATGALTGSNVDLTLLTPGVYNFTYTVTGIGTCPDDSETVVVTVEAAPDAGTATPFVVCETDLAANSPLDLFGQLSGADTGGTWNDDDATGALSGSNVDLTLLTPGSYNFTYSVSNNTGCTDTETVVITVETQPEAGVANTFEVCIINAAGNSPLDLFTLLSGFDAGGTWTDDDATGALTGSNVDLTLLAAGMYDFTYTTTGTACNPDTATVTITIEDVPEAGTATPFIVCETDLAANSPLDLFGQLSGFDAGGTWNDDNATGALSGSDVDLTLLAPGSYNFTYTVSNNTGCDDSETVTVTVETQPEAGTGTPFDICIINVAANSPLDLFNQISGFDTGGTWNDDDATGALTGSMVDLTVLTAGMYDFTYTVVGMGSCTPDNVTVTVTIEDEPEAGTATPFILCEADLAANSPFDLFGQLTGNDAGGTWSDDDATGALTGSNVDLTALTPGSYNFTYTVSNNTGCDDTATVTITIETQPEAGTGTPFVVCLIDVPSNTPLDLFNQITGFDTGGTWADDDATGALTGSNVDLTALTPGTYNFTYSVNMTTTCSPDTVTVSVTINETPAPTGDAVQEFCIPPTPTVADLVATGNAIQWYADATSTTPLASTEDLIDGEDYYATQTDATTGCESSTRLMVTVNFTQEPIAGLDGTLNVCETATAVDVSTGLGGTPDAGGTWNDDDATGALTGSIFDASAVGPGTYMFTYTVAATGPCVDDNATVTVIVDAVPNAGTDNAIAFCSTDAATDLFTLLGTADTGGTWSPALTSGTGVFDPAVDAAGTYTYTVDGGACGTASASVDVTVDQAPNAGDDASTQICVSGGSIDLSTVLGGTPDTGGTWNDDNATGGLTGSTFDPTGIATGTYTFTYTVLATGACTVDDSAVVTVTVDDTAAPTATDQTFCAADNPTVADLVATGSNIFWYADATSTTPLNGTDVLVDGEDYFATETANGCESLRTMITVTVEDAATPTIISEGNLLCINDNPTIADLTTNVTTPGTIVWYDAPTGGTAYSDTELLVNGQTYYAAISDATSGCESSVRLEVTVDLSGCDGVFIPDGFSPNGDSINDTFEIKNIDVIFPNYQITIYNRNGSIIFQGGAGRPFWDGTSKESRVIGNGAAPNGVYFYVIEYNDGNTEPKQGRLYLNR